MEKSSRMIQRGEELVIWTLGRRVDGTAAIVMRLMNFQFTEEESFAITLKQAINYHMNHLRTTSKHSVGCSVGPIHSNPKQQIFLGEQSKD